MRMAPPRRKGMAQSTLVIKAEVAIVVDVIIDAAAPEVAMTSMKRLESQQR